MACNIGSFVDTAFMQWDPVDGFIGAPKNRRDPKGGGHDYCFLGHTRASDLAARGRDALPDKIAAHVTPAWHDAIRRSAEALAADAFINYLQNSWGPSWGIGGYGLATDDLLTDWQTRDGVVMEPKLTEAG